MTQPHNFAECPSPQECDLHRRVPAPDIPEEAIPHVIAYLRWMADDDGAHGGTFCRWDRNWLGEEADRLEGTGRHAEPAKVAPEGGANHPRGLDGDGAPARDGP